MMEQLGYSKPDMDGNNLVENGITSSTENYKG